MKLKCYVPDRYALYISPGDEKIEKIKFFLHGIDHFLSLKNGKNIKGDRFKELKLSLLKESIFISVSIITFNKIDLYFGVKDYAKDKDIPFYIQNKYIKTLQFMVIHTEEFVVYTSNAS